MNVKKPEILQLWAGGVIPGSARVFLTGRALHSLVISRRSGLLPGVVCALGDCAGRYTGCTAHRSARRSRQHCRFFRRAAMNLVRLQYKSSQGPAQHHQLSVGFCLRASKPARLSLRGTGHPRDPGCCCSVTDLTWELL